MKAKNIKKALSLFLAVLMIALALPLTLLTVGAEGGQVTISNVEMTLKKSNGNNWNAQYGSVNGMIDGDKYDETRSANDSYPYFYSPYLRSNSKYYYLDDSGKLVESTEDTSSTYRGYVVFKLSALSEMNSLTIWLAADGSSSSSAAAWSNPALNWNICNAYDILSSTDGKTWTVHGEFDDMCGTGSTKGAGFPEEGDSAYAYKEQDGYDRVGHKVALNDTIAKYVAVAIKEGNNETASKGEALHAVVIGEVTVEGTEYSAPVDVDVAGMQISTTDSGAFRFIGTTTGLNVEEIGFRVDIAHSRDEKENTVPASINAAEMTLKKSNGNNWNAQYGSVNGMIDGDKYDETRSANDSYPYFYSPYLRSNSKYYYLDDSGKLVESTEDTSSTYRGYVVFKLSALSEMNSLTIWLAADGSSSSNAAAWSNPALNWNICNAYDILSSTDGETWTVHGEFDDMCGTGSTKGAGFPEEGDSAYAYKEQDGYDRVGHKVALNDTIAKYVAVAIKEGNNETASSGEALHAVVIGEVTIEGMTVADTVKVTKNATFTDGTTTVYNSILADGKTVSFDDKYVYALGLEGVPQYGTVDIDVTPYYIPADSDMKIYGEAGSFTIVDGVVTEDTTDTVNVMAYNINNGQVGNKVASQRLDYIAAQINSVDPDVVVLNEAHNYDPEHPNYDITISELTAKCDVSYGIVDFVNEKAKNVILYNTDKYTFVSSEIIELTNTADDGSAGDEYDRTAVFARLKRISDNKEFVVAAIHFDQVKGVAKMQAWEVNYHLADNYDDIGQIVAGDFNFTSKVHDEENGASTVHTYPFIEEGYTDANVDADHTATKDEKVIDFIYSKGFDASDYTVVKAANATKASDHYAVYAELTLN